jgi:predicted nucleotidyltransferase
MGKKSNPVIKVLENFKRKVERRVNVAQLILFGSRASGKAKKESDVDIIIVSKDFEGQKSFKRAPMFYYDWDYDYDTDIICLTPEELEKKKNQIGIIKNALKRSIQI